MTGESAMNREKIATGGENADMGPEVDIKDLTKRNDEIQKGLQGQFQTTKNFLKRACRTGPVPR